MEKIKYLDLQKVTQTFEPELSEAIRRVIEVGWFLYGNETHTFEDEFARFCGRKYCLGVANGLDALTLILKCYKDLSGWADGDEVIVPAFTFIASVEAITRVGLKPVFCDVKPTDCLIDESLIERLITQRTKAVMPVHLYGKACRMDAICEVARKYKLKIVEDAAQAHGAFTADDRRVGSLGEAAGFSFYPGKNLGALGDGGAIVTNDEDVIAYSKMMANYGMKKKYVHDVKGLNSRLDELQAAVLRVKLHRLDADNKVRQNIARRYYKEVTNELLKLPYSKETEKSIYHIFPIFCEHRDELQTFLTQKGIQTQIHYPIPPYKQKAYKEYNHLTFPVAEKIARTELSIPLNQSLTEEEITYIISSLNQFVC